MRIYQKIDELVGHTPLLRLNNIEKEFNLDVTLLAKLESFNPTGSAKDRPAKAIIEKAEKDGILKENSVIIEPTSGNTGIGLAAIGAAKGHNEYTAENHRSVRRSRSDTGHGFRAEDLAEGDVFCVFRGELPHRPPARDDRSERHRVSARDFLRDDRNAAPDGRSGSDGHRSVFTSVRPETVQDRKPPVLCQ